MVKLRRGKKKRRCQNRQNAIMDERMRAGGINAKGPCLAFLGGFHQCEARYKGVREEP